MYYISLKRCSKLTIFDKYLWVEQEEENMSQMLWVRMLTWSQTDVLKDASTDDDDHLDLVCLEQWQVFQEGEGGAAWAENSKNKV